MKRLVICVCLACLSCIGGRLETRSPAEPRLGLAAPGIAHVGHPWPLTIILRGDFPHGPIVLQATAERRLMVNKTVDVDLARYYLYRVYFDDTFYVAVAQEQRKAGWEWDGIVRVEVRTAELMYTTTSGWRPGAPIAESWKILRLYCWQCETEEANERKREPAS